MEGLYLSASGIANALRRNEVTANNVANVRTTGFRAGRAESVETVGGGAAVGGVTPDDAAGPFEFTGNPMDVAAGTGFFRVRMSDGGVAYTRDGHFGLNATGEVVTAAGARLEPAIQVPANAAHVTVARDGSVYATFGGELGPQVVGQIEVFQFSNPAGLLALGGNLYQQTPASGEPQPLPEAMQFYPGAVQGSNVNLPHEMGNSLLDRQAFQANAKAFRAQSDVLGELIDIIS